jgi:hypothetical protein
VNKTKIKLSQKVVAIAFLALFWVGCSKPHPVRGPDPKTPHETPHVESRSPESPSPPKQEFNLTWKKVKKNIVQKFNRFQISALTMELLINPKSRPVAKLKLENYTFFFSNLIRVKGDSRTYAIMYAQDKKGQKVYPRLLYHSLSDGNWRSPPYLIGGHFLKEGADNGSHYTQETKLVPQLTDVLIDFEEKGMISTVEQSDSPTRKFHLGAIRNDLTYMDEVRYYIDVSGTLSLSQKYKPGNFIRELTQEEKFRIHDDPTYHQQIPTVIGSVPDLKEKFGKIVAKNPISGENFFPDFENGIAIRKYFTNHSLLSQKGKRDILIRVYRSTLAQESVEWHMAQDKKGRIWIDRIHFTDAPINSYGLYSIVIDSGALTSKPLEYQRQVPGLNFNYTPPFLDYQPHGYPVYVDFTPILNELAPIRAYRQKWAIPYEIGDSI